MNNVLNYDYSKICNEKFNICRPNCKIVKISEIEYDELKGYAKEIASIAKVENRKLKDKDGLYSRFLSGLIGEYAIGKYLGRLDLFNAYSAGGSYGNNHADCLCYNYKIGVKTSYLGRTIKLNRNSSTSQIICQYTKNMVYGEDGLVVFICGILPLEYIKFYGKLEYIEDEDLRKSGTKLGFFDFDRLIPFDLEILNTEYSINVKSYNLINDVFKVSDLFDEKTEFVYMEKKSWYFIEFLPCPIIEDDDFLFYRLSSDFKDTPNELEKVLDRTQGRIVIGFGITGYIHILQEMYNGNKKYNINFLDIWDIMLRENRESATYLNEKWINSITVWEDFLTERFRFFNDENKSILKYHFNLCVIYLNYNLNNLLSICGWNICKYVSNSLKNISCLQNTDSPYIELLKECESGDTKKWV